MQQARDSRAEKTGEVVRNHEVGTGLLVWLARGRRCGGDIALGVDALEHVDEGAMRSADTFRAAMPGTMSVRTNPKRGGRFPTGAKQQML
jgi:hypothetical protein